VPELPEVETVRDGLERFCVGRTVETVRVLHPRAVRRNVTGPAGFEQAMSGRPFKNAERRGKYLWLTLDDDEALLAHLGMSGQLLVGEPGRPLSPHVRVQFTFTDGGPDLRFTDQRTFGHLLFVPDGAELPGPIAHIAPDPLEEVFDDDGFATALRRRRTGVKRALLDQSLISGVGNIYADEALYRARLHPLSPAGSMKPEHWEALRDAVVAALEAGIDAGGSSIDDYRDGRGEKGRMQERFLVHTREGQPCPGEDCDGVVERIVVSGRSTYFCPSCQVKLRKRPKRRKAKA